MQKIIISLGSLVWAFGYFVYKALDHYAFSITRFRETRLGRKYLSAFEGRIAAATKRAAAWKVKDKLIDIKRACEKIAATTLLLFLGVALLGGMFNVLLNGVAQFILMVLMATFLLASLGRFCFEWTFNHKRILKEAATYFAVVLGLFYLLFVLVVVAYSPLGTSTGSHQLQQLVSITIAMALLTIVAMGIMYGATWVLLGTPVAFGGITVLVTRGVAGFLVRRYSEETLIYAATLARVVTWTTPFVTILLSLIMSWLGIGGALLPEGWMK